MQPRSFRVEIRIALIEPMTSSTNSSTSLGQLLASARFARDQPPFIGVELRSIGGEVFDMQSAMLSQQLLERCSLVGGRIVQNHDHLAPETDIYLRTVISSDNSRVFFNSGGAVFYIDTATDARVNATVDENCCYGDYDLALSANQSQFEGSGYLRPRLER